MAAEPQGVRLARPLSNQARLAVGGASAGPARPTPSRACSRGGPLTTDAGCRAGCVLGLRPVPHVEEGTQVAGPPSTLSEKLSPWPGLRKSFQVSLTSRLSLDQKEPARESGRKR